MYISNEHTKRVSPGNQIPTNIIVRVKRDTPSLEKHLIVPPQMCHVKIPNGSWCGHLLLPYERPNQLFQTHIQEPSSINNDFARQSQEAFNHERTLEEVAMRVIYVNIDKHNWKKTNKNTCKKTQT